MEDFEKSMEGLKKPSLSHVQPPYEIKLAVVNSQRSAAIGIWFVIVPYFFLACMLLKYQLQVNLGLLDLITQAIERIDKNSATWWLQPLLLIILPVAGIVVNILSITHFFWDATHKLITVTIKIRWINLIVLFFSVLILTAFLLYLIGENFQMRSH
jgi:lantibiotic transport system permease protein